ncbi:hypothetical protein HMPREF7215_2214 [Pyramidobacter piscolens W5455]|uniref:Uncharacterized protein n=1 Tax=Pyramidobacter piscolens W5455 TaxID=352165 RepID=A0ABM9ZQZ0_9BACT|nr:hypothetical protein HMPREF7215_2214 [Pyramidobacter piscolens W5455]
MTRGSRSWGRAVTNAIDRPVRRPFSSVPAVAAREFSVFRKAG